MLFYTKCGHIIAGIILKFRVQKLNILPFGFSVNFKIDTKNYNKKILKGSLLSIKKIIIAFAGPLVNLLLIFIILSMKREELFNIKTEVLIYTNALIFIFNMIAIYPLDGGRILKNLMHILFGKIEALKITNIISLVMSIVLTIACLYISVSLKNYSYIFILVYVWIIAIKSIKTTNTKIKIYKCGKTVTRIDIVKEEK